MGTGLDGSFVSTGACNLYVGTRLESRSGRIFTIVVVHNTVLQTIQRPVVYSAAYGTVYYKKPLKSFEIRVRHSPGGTVSDHPHVQVTPGGNLKLVSSYPLQFQITLFNFTGKLSMITVIMFHFFIAWRWDRF